MTAREEELADARARLKARIQTIVDGSVEIPRFDEALTSLTDFLSRYPDHEYADNALYWRGEIFYARRQYADAAREFDHFFAGAVPLGVELTDIVMLP